MHMAPVFPYLGDRLFFSCLMKRSCSTAYGFPVRPRLAASARWLPNIAITIYLSEIFLFSDTSQDSHSHENSVRLENR